MSKIENRKNMLQFERLFENISPLDILNLDWMDRYGLPFRKGESNSNFPPHNIIKEFDDSYTVEVALAGFSKSDIEVKLNNNMLYIQSQKENQTDNREVGGEEYKMNNIQYYHKGIAKRNFMLKFRLPPHSKIHDCYMENGILYVKIKIELPEEKKPKTIDIR